MHSTTCGGGGAAGGGGPDGKGIGDIGKILPKFDKVEVEYIEPEKAELILKKAALKKKKEVLKQTDGFWGIGIYLELFHDELVPYNGLVYSPLKVREVVYGNPAWKVGLQKGDLIFLVNGKAPGFKNDIKGDKPSALRLGISRNGKIFFIDMERGWIATDERGAHKGKKAP